MNRQEPSLIIDQFASAGRPSDLTQSGLDDRSAAVPWYFPLRSSL